MVPNVWNPSLVHKDSKWPPFCSDFKWSGHSVLECHSNTEPFNDQTGLDHSNTKHIRYLSPYCTWEVIFLHLTFDIFASCTWNTAHFGERLTIESEVECTGMLRHAFEPLDGCNLLWHIVAPPPSPLLVSFFLILQQIWFSRPIWLDVWLHEG